ncbi:MAG: hypothetical protein ACKOFE_00685, partial [Bacteroidota bacterium]
SPSAPTSSAPTSSPDLFGAAPTAHAVRTYADGGKTYTLVQTETEYRQLLSTLESQKTWALDTETDGLDPLEAGMVGFSGPGKITARYLCGFPMNEPPAKRGWIF